MASRHLQPNFKSATPNDVKLMNEWNIISKILIISIYEKKCLNDTQKCIPHIQLTYRHKDMHDNKTNERQERKREREREADRHKEKQMKTITGTRYKTKYLPSTTTYIEYYVIEYEVLLCGFSSFVHQISIKFEMKSRDR